MPVRMLHWLQLLQHNTVSMMLSTRIFSYISLLSVEMTVIGEIDNQASILNLPTVRRDVELMADIPVMSAVNTT
jgi:hypothetical protein